MIEDGWMDWKMYFNLINQQTWIYFQSWEGDKKLWGIIVMSSRQQVLTKIGLWHETVSNFLSRQNSRKVDNTILNPAMIYLYGLLSSIVFYSCPWIFPRLIVLSSPGASVVSLSAADWQDKPTMGPAPCPCRRHSTEAAELGGKQVVCLCQNI